ncbi:unnamed protein product, partial [Ectocarpus sp. 12 AP-2014]
AGGVGRLELSLDGDSEVAVGIAVSFTPGASFQGWEGGHLFRGIIRLYESRNEDVVKELPCFAQVYSSALAYQAAVVPPGSPSLVDETEELEVLSPLMQHKPPPPPLDPAGGGSRGSGGGGGSPPASPRGGKGLPELSRQTMRVLSGERGDQQIHHPYRPPPPPPPPDELPSEDAAGNGG